MTAPVQRIVLDACVLYPTVLRELLMGAAGAGLYRPLWSARILEEWARAVARSGPAAEAIARGEVALARSRFPAAEIRVPPEAEARLWLPDENDRHVLAAALAGHADAILTLNARDFPRGLLAEEGLQRLDPDAFLLSLLETAPAPMTAIIDGVVAEARRLSGEDWTARSLLKKARLWRLARRVAEV